MIVTNGGRVFNAGSIVLGDFGTGVSNNLLKVTGAGSMITAAVVSVGLGSAHNQMLIEDGGLVRTMGINRIGIQATASNNLVTVTGTGSIWSNASSIVVGSSGNGNRLVITNGGTVFAADVTLGESVGSGNSILVQDQGQLVVSGGLTLGPNSQPVASNNLVKVSGAGSKITTGGAVNVGAGSAGNQMLIEDGGSVSSVGVNRIGNQAPASNNLVVVTGQGSVWSNTLSIVVGNVGNGNRLVITNGGAVFAPDILVSGNSSTGNSILGKDRGLLDANTLSVPTAGNSISNIGGIYQFTTPTPVITAGRVFITNGTVSFRAINNAPTAPLANLTYEGNNTLRLNNATNVNPVSL